MTEYGDLDIATALERIETASKASRTLEGLCWLHLGDYVADEDGPIGSPVPPRVAVCGKTMREGMSLGLHGVESAFWVPSLMTDLGAAMSAAEGLFPSAVIDIRTGGGTRLHMATVKVDGYESAHGISRLSGAAALCSALLRATMRGREIPSVSSINAIDDTRLPTDH